MIRYPSAQYYSFFDGSLARAGRAGVLRFIPALIALVLITVGHIEESQGFEYLEHSYISDRACWQAQLKLGELLEERPDDDALRARYLAMAIACPEGSPAHYCEDDQKTATAQIGPVSTRLWRRSHHHLTLGDITALGDHLGHPGPIRGLPGAEEPGLTRDFLSWFADKDGSVGGVIGRVVRKACSTNEEVSWSEVETDVDAVTSELFTHGEPQPIPSPFLAPIARHALNEGPGDPEARLTISNPHYLDLVLRNHHHFGAEAFDTWLGFHSASVAIAQRPCDATYAINRRKSRKMAKDLEAFKEVDWKNLSDSQLAATGCDVLAEHTRRRLLSWQESADDVLSAPVNDFLNKLRELPATTDDADTARLRYQLDMVVASLKALVFQGSGLHFLQDGFAGGHVRTLRARGGLAEARHDHNYDNEAGVSAILRTRAGDFPFVAFGDKFLLGRHHVTPEHCDWQQFQTPSMTPKQVGACLLRYQRGLVVATSAASLMDWASGGMLFEPVDPSRCTRSDLESTVCNMLPLMPVSSAGSLPPRAVSEATGVYPGNLPVPPPPFDYQSLVTTVAFDVAGSKSQYGLQLTLLSEFDRFAHWLTSYRAALFASNGVGEDNRISGEFSYNFHYRGAARVIAEAGLGAVGGFQGFGGDEGLTFMAGLAPSTGLVVLPEGWVKIPLELSVSFRLPLTFFTSQHGFFRDSFEIEAFWLQFGLGLAFM